MAGDSWIEDRLAGSLAAIESLRAHIRTIDRLAATIVRTLQQGGTIFTCGNGGSAAEALHLAEELIGRYRGNRPSCRAVCLNADPTALTCIANDFGFDEVFARQLEGLARPHDVLVVFSTSGKSRNLVLALERARRAQVRTIGLLGRNGGECLALCDEHLIVEATDSAHIQEAHQVVMHLLCEAVERSFSSPG